MGNKMKRIHWWASSTYWWRYWTCCAIAMLLLAGCAPAASEQAERADIPAPSPPPAAPSEPAAPASQPVEEGEIGEVVEGGSCNAETGEPGPGEGVFERDVDGGLSCVSQEGEGDSVGGVGDVLTEAEARKLYRDTIGEVEDKLGDLPIDDEVPAGEFLTDRYAVEEEALSEATDALWRRQEDELAECDERDPDFGDEWSECYDEATKRHDEENDWINARTSQVYESVGQ